MARRDIHPVHHSVVGKAGHMVGQGADKGFRWGTVGAVLGATLLGGIGYGTYSTIIAAGTVATTTTSVGIGASLLAAGTAVVAAIPYIAAGAVALGVTAFVAIPVLTGATVLGGAVGLFSGAKGAARHTNQENAAAKYQQGYGQAHAATEARLAQMMTPPEALVQTAATPEATILNDNIPTNSVSAASIDYQSQQAQPTHEASMGK